MGRCAPEGIRVVHLNAAVRMCNARLPRYPSALFVVLTSLAPVTVFAQANPPDAPATPAATGPHAQPAPSVSAVRLTAPVTIDGKLDEDVWRTAAAATDFRQSQPDEGKPATQRTEVRFAYDDVALYVGARLLDSLGEKGVRTRLLRRDALTETDSDILQLI